MPAGPSLPGPRLTGLAETGSQCRRRAQGSARSGPPARGSSTPPPLPPPPRPAPRPPLPHFPQEMINSGRGVFPWQRAREGARALSRTRLPRAHAPSTPPSAQAGKTYVPTPWCTRPGTPACAFRAGSHPPLHTPRACTLALTQPAGTQASHFYPGVNVGKRLHSPSNGLYSASNPGAKVSRTPAKSHTHPAHRLTS